MSILVVLSIFIALVAADHDYWCIKNNNHGCCCTNGGIGTFCNFPNSEYSAAIVNSTVEVTDPIYVLAYGRAMVFTDTSGNSFVITLTPLTILPSGTLYFGYHKLTDGCLEWLDGFYVIGDSQVVCNIPAKTAVPLFGPNPEKILKFK